MKLNLGDIGKKVKTYEDVAAYYTDFLNDLYKEEIRQGRIERHEVPSPQDLAFDICIRSAHNKMHDDEIRRRFLNNIDEMNERLDKIEAVLDELEDRR